MNSVHLARAYNRVMLLIRKRLQGRGETDCSPRRRASVLRALAFVLAACVCMGFASVSAGIATDVAQPGIMPVLPNKADAVAVHTGALPMAGFSPVGAIPSFASAPFSTAQSAANPVAEGNPLALTAAELRYVADHPLWVAGFGEPLEPVLYLSRQNEPSGVAIQLLSHLRTLVGVQLRFVPMSEGMPVDLLCYVPDDVTAASAVGLRLSEPYITLPLTLVYAKNPESAASAAVEGNWLQPAGLQGVTRSLYSYPTARACLDAVLSGEQPVAILNSYAVPTLLMDPRYAALQSQRLEGASVTVCFAVPASANALMLSILNKLVRHISVTEGNLFLIDSLLDNKPINLASIANHMPSDVALVLVGILLALALLMTATILRNIRFRREQARTAEIAAFLDYANKINDDVWEIDIQTTKRWRYRVERGEILRIPMPDFSVDIMNRYVYPDDLAAVLSRMHAIVSEAFVASQGQERFECRILPEGGAQYKWVRVVFQAMLPSREHPHGLMVYIMDVDAAIHAEEETNLRLRKALDMAQAASKAKSDFTAYISHEIRSPLNAVLGYLALARHNVDQPLRLEECFSKSELAASHMLQLLNNVLDMGAIESGHLQISQTAFDVRQLLETVGSLFAAQAKSRDITYRVDSGVPACPRLIGDDLRLKQVLVNLLSNAIKFTPKGGSVAMVAVQFPVKEGSTNMRFTVSDTGAGMTEAFQQRLFNPYTQQDASIAGQFGGNGLGLSITKRLLDLMNGEITVQSASGQGTTFTVNIAFKVDTAPIMPEAPPHTAHATFVGRRLLLVEDNEMNMEIATELLREEGGFAIDGATNGREALERFTHSVPGAYDAILMDVHMPEMNGYEATRAIRASDRPDAAAIPIFAMSANAFAEDVQLALDAGMNGHIAKPIDFRLVLETLSRVLQH